MPTDNNDPNNTGSKTDEAPADTLNQPLPAANEQPTPDALLNNTQTPDTLTEATPSGVNEIQDQINKTLAKDGMANSTTPQMQSETPAEMPFQKPSFNVVEQPQSEETPASDFPALEPETPSAAPAETSAFTPPSTPELGGQTDNPVQTTQLSEEYKPLQPNTEPEIQFTSQMDIPPEVTNQPTEQPKETKVVDAGPTADELSTNTLVTTDNKPKRSFFPIIMFVLILITVAILSGVAYLYIQNNKKADEAPVTDNKEEMLAFSPEQIQIINGNVERVLPFGKSEILIDKNDYPATGIAGFARVVVSPDNTKLCFESWPPSIEPELFVSDITGQNVIIVNQNSQNCTFGPMGNRIFFNKIRVGNNPTDIFSYNLNTEITTNLTEDMKESENILLYELIGITVEGDKLACSLREEDPETGELIGEPQDCTVEI